MNLVALKNAATDLGTQLPNTQSQAVDRLGELEIPVLVIVGDNDIPYMHAAAKALEEKLNDSRHVTIANAAHLPNMDQPTVFASELTSFLEAKLGNID